jgi:hypothetical protein
MEFASLKDSGEKEVKLSMMYTAFKRLHSPQKIITPVKSCAECMRRT